MKTGFFDLKKKLVENSSYKKRGQIRKRAISTNSGNAAEHIKISLGQNITNSAFWKFGVLIILWGDNQSSDNST